MSTIIKTSEARHTDASLTAAVVTGANNIKGVCKCCGARVRQCNLVYGTPALGSFELDFYCRECTRDLRVSELVIA